MTSKDKKLAEVARCVQHALSGNFEPLKQNAQDWATRKADLIKEVAEIDTILAIHEKFLGGESDEV